MVEFNDINRRKKRNAPEPQILEMVARTGNLTAEDERHR
jgi:hypothetical protein